MNNRFITKIVITILCFAGLCLILQKTRILACYTVSSKSLLPYYNQGSHIICSSLKAFTYNDIVCFKTDHHPTVQLLRIAGMPGDTLEIKDGYLIRNGFFADHAENLLFRYEARRQFIGDSLFFNTLLVHPETVGNMVHFYLTVKEYARVSRILLLHKATQNNTMDGNDRNFPGVKESNNAIKVTFTVPQNHYFLLGDNRDNANDSRSFGCIRDKDILATVLLPQ